jgi:hypothetical protein
LRKPRKFSGIVVSSPSSEYFARVEIGGPDGFTLVFRQLAAVDIHLEGALEIRGAISESLHWNSVGQVSHTEA